MFKDIVGKNVVHGFLSTAIQNPIYPVIRRHAYSWALVHLSGTGKVMIGMASRDLKDKEKTAYPDLIPIVVGLDGIALVVNKDNPLTDLNKEQVQKIYTGQIANWKDLGGGDADIELTAMGTNHGTHELFVKYFGLEAEVNAKKQMKHRIKGEADFSSVLAKSMETSKEGLAAVMTNPNAIAYVSIGAAQKIIQKGGAVKVVNLEGIAATVENVALRKYPLCRNLHVLTKGEATGVAKEFIDYLTHDEQGQKIVAELDYIPLQEMKKAQEMNAVAMSQ